MPDVEEHKYLLLQMKSDFDQKMLGVQKDIDHIRGKSDDLKLKIEKQEANIKWGVLAVVGYVINSVLKSTGVM